ncbi:sugar ABC transporter substrate-binding protein [Embleya sp. NPDC020886]|uniref:sugar ABC transporter substrate-binding protein n=1 Tax=Embleya sp. NPDC020886 TaxID=3363980 RepID=UPI003792B6E9
MRRRMKIGSAVAVAVLTTTMAACDDSASTKAGGDSYTVGVVRFASSDPASESILNAYVDYAKKKGWRVSSVDSQGAPDKAISGIGNYVQKKVDLIVIAIFPSDTLAAGVRQAKGAGIPVVSVGGGTAEGVQASLDFGRSNAKDTSKLLTDDLGGKGDVLLLGYKSGLPCVGREQELDDQLTATDIHVTRKEVPIPGQVEAGSEFTRAWLTTHPEGKGKLAVWGCFGDPARGAISALQAAGRKDVLVYGHDGTPAAIEAVRRGDLRATSYFDPTAEGAKLGELTPGFVKAGSDAKPRDLAPEMYLVTPESVGEFLKKFPNALG